MPTSGHGLIRLDMDELGSCVGVRVSADIWTRPHPFRLEALGAVSTFGHFTMDRNQWARWTGIPTIGVYIILTIAVVAVIGEMTD